MSYQIGAKMRTHGLTKTPEYCSWQSMKRRCLNKKEKEYKYWGGRGISICDKWINSFENFVSDMGKKPSDLHSLDRIDNDKGYYKENCRWATKEEQSKNRRNSIMVGDLCLKEYCKMNGLQYDLMRYRIVDAKWSIDRAVNTPNRQIKRYIKT